MSLCTFIIIFLLVLSLTGTSQANYWQERQDFINNDRSSSIGYNTILTDKENIVNRMLMDIKLREYDQGFGSPQNFPPALHFFRSKSLIEKSQVFKFIQKLPKGASLHSHDTALVSFDYLFKLTFRDHLYGCIQNKRLKLKFFAPNATENNCDWKLLKDWRVQNKTINKFIRRQLTIIVKNPHEAYPSINNVWKRFLDTFDTVRTFVTYRPIFQQYFYQALKELYEDNVFYLEFRGLLPEVYELNGTVYTPEQIVGLYIETLKQFKSDYPDFHGARFIYAPSRGVDNKTADSYVKLALKLKNLYPDFIAGFDLVGPEDKGKPLFDFVPQLLELSGKIKFFFHAAETDWNGSSTDLNIVDAILLNTTRIGHGYAAVKHPQVLKEIKDRSIAIEISPISNQVLKLVDDLRNHPGAVLMAGGYPVVICCDDPSFWGAKGLSYDWYLAFMGMASRESDLRFLKEIAINSVVYSAMDGEEKYAAIAQWKKQWDRFIDEMVATALRDTHSNFISPVM